MSLNLAEIRARVEDVKIKRAKAQERIASLEKQAKEIMDSLKGIGIKTEADIEPRIEELQGKLAGLVKTLDDIEQGRAPVATKPEPEAKAKPAKAAATVKKGDEDDLLKELGL